jgi:creatinine amidohydrolase
MTKEEAPQVRKTKRWAELPTTAFQALDMERIVAVLPVAAVEQHGPHLPVGTDSLIMEGYLDQSIAAMPDDLPVLILPTQCVGKSNEHVEFPGTLTLSAETAVRAWTEIGESVHRAGVKKLLIMNSHGGNVPIIDIVARDLRARFGMLVVNASWSRLGYPDGLFSPAERQHGIHGGEIETAWMLHFRPDLVEMEQARDFTPASVEIERRFSYLRVTQPIGFGWMAQDVSEAGAIGNAALGTAEKGARTAEHGVAGFLALLQDMLAFDLDRLKDGPLKRR